MNTRIAHDTEQVEFDSSLDGAVINTEPVMTRQEFMDNEEVYAFYCGDYFCYVSEQH
jgi:hypothetical protein